VFAAAGFILSDHIDQSITVAKPSNRLPGRFSIIETTTHRNPDPVVRRLVTFDVP